MKKILIATACAFTLCLTSCASKAAPETESDNQAPQTEIEENETQTESESTSENAEEASAGEVAAEESSAEEQPEEDSTITSEDFPEPEFIKEPEIITLEPVEEVIPEEKEEASEEVKEEEPPVIVIEENKPEEETEENDDQQNSNEENQSEADDQTEDVETTEATGPSDSDDDGITVIGGGIDITDEVSAADEKYNEKAEDITPSRSVTLKKFEYLDVTYPGTGWIYMGLVDNSKDIAYFGRKLGTKDTKFSLQARNAGKKIVHFYRNDPLTGNYLDDYLEIIILSENGSNKTHIAAPEYKLPVQKKEKPVKKTKESESSDNSENESKAEVAQTAANTKTSAAATTTNSAASTSSPTTSKTSTNTAATTNSKPTATSTATATTTATASSTASTSATTVSQEEISPVTEATSTDSSTLLKEAQLLYNEKEYKAALNKLNQFFEYSTDKGDEALYLKGQILEAKSDVRDIKGAIDAYTTLTKNYPASKLWDSANKRIIYLKRFYLEVR